MTRKEFLRQITKLLVKEKDELLKQIKTDHGTIDADGDETDEIQANQLIELSNQLSTRNSERLLRIEGALHRISNGSYGLCQNCEEPIADKRLLANPHFQNCVMCAETQEAEEKQRKRM